MAIRYYEPVVASLEYDDTINDESLKEDIIHQLSKADERITQKMREIDLQEERSWARARIRNIGIFFESE